VVKLCSSLTGMFFPLTSAIFSLNKECSSTTERVDIATTSSSSRAMIIQLADGLGVPVERREQSSGPPQTHRIVAVRHEEGAYFLFSDVGIRFHGFSDTHPVLTVDGEQPFGTLQHEQTERSFDVPRQAFGG
jgi:hypothetical protein